MQTYLSRTILRAAVRGCLRPFLSGRWKADFSNPHISLPAASTYRQRGREILLGDRGDQTT